MSEIQTPEFSPELEVEERVRKVELLISNLLRTGVIFSLGLIVLGTVVSFAQHPEYLTERFSVGSASAPRTAILHSLSDVAAGLKAFNGEAIVTLGILLLIATPVVRVGVSIFAFIYQRDRLYTFITATVFCLLLLSFVLGKVE
jgi:uncharacterized membrane protein